ncbi:HAMP domain-containing sensor histidine kinase [Mycolicibacterium sp. 050158]|uniref:sensor histidine kinase n=1 Tax=Mycolicibacterium sp. 050158 TaxID=3090602 RepID=UPI00299E3E7D|nr:HAMP domain-containing sensor histidine kinase [Mycolicibacterium sp. 050158]MDX1890748.1 HAMP domain-containing sensor histidine kinase [Mycolicibacterium sp. 050158]
MTHADNDFLIVRRAGRRAALQASLALAGVLLVVGGVVYAVDVRVQNRQITDQLTAVAATADDAVDPPPGMQIVLRDQAGRVQQSTPDLPSAELLARPAGYSAIRVGGASNRVLVVDKPEGRIVVLLAMNSFEEARGRLLLALGAAELAGILASIAVVVLLTRRSLRPLTQALALQRRFVADASHELRAPLTLLHTRIQLLARRFEDGDAHQAKEQIDALAADTRVLSEVIEDLLASASMSAGAVPRARVDAAQVAAEVHASMVEPALSAGVTLVMTREPEDSDVTVLGSAVALRRAITSLVDNALAHEHRGGVVTIHVERRNLDVIVEVRDDGVGVDPEAVADLFTRFSHGSGPTTTGRPRYGIGLTLVRETAVAHGGRVEVAPTPGGGATFRLVLPVATGA